MKTLTKLFAFLMLATFVFSSCSQQVYVEKRNNPYKFTGIVNVNNNVSKDILYYNARLWFMNTFKDSKAVLEIDDKVNYVIAGKGVLRYEPRVFSGSDGIRGFINFSVFIYIKDGKYKYEITNFYHEPIGRYGTVYSLHLITDDQEYTGPKNTFFGLGHDWYNRVFQDIKEQINLKIEPSLIDLKNTMEKNNNDW